MCDEEAEQQLFLYFWVNQQSDYLVHCNTTIQPNVTVCCLDKTNREMQDLDADRR